MATPPLISSTVPGRAQDVLRSVVPHARMTGVNTHARLWPAMIFTYIMGAIEKGFSSKITKRRFFGQYDHH